ncbi:phosphatase PAP2 family protein [Arsenicicoccus piscis]|uniref:Phosphatidic acid phosphatase type 2/haloperoxidase domain-containing protein n=1 Tax=Arsenicicoccus piscis TaxID=673954 RepID=A0ABQ6HHL7_9MICO|nr:phosphatase PAP2 family protein [Arsenicicoccus piscis]MCH8627623.1 phosphatase PAP2 family protein [Arsenicicoccus piscis]GMA18114.1 hypothetical protein GCM10025862_01350 [Arsenicicoccus piscis]
MLTRPHVRLSGTQAAATVVVSVAGIAGLYQAMVRTLAGQAFDQAAMTRIAALSPRVRVLAAEFLSPITPVTFGAALAVLALLALAQRRPVAALGALGAVVGSVLTAELLKEVLTRPEIAGHTMDNSFPSGHVAGVAALVAAAVIVAPHRARRFVRDAGVLLIGAAGVSVVALQWHRPSDVAASALVALAWGAAGLWATDRAERTVYRRAAGSSATASRSTETRMLVGS